MDKQKDLSTEGQPTACNHSGGGEGSLHGKIPMWAGGSRGWGCLKVKKFERFQVVVTWETSCEQTDTTENITFLQLRLRAVIISHYAQLCLDICKIKYDVTKTS